MKFDLHVYHHHAGGSDPVGLQERLFYLERDVKLIANRLEKIMASIDELVAAANAETTVDDSIIALLVSIKAQLDAALAGALSPENQAKVDQVFATISANSKKVADAVVANTPAGP